MSSQLPLKAPAFGSPVVWQVRRSSYPTEHYDIFYTSQSDDLSDSRLTSKSSMQIRYVGK